MSKSPFKFLDPYTKEDTDIFFGRDREIEELYTRVFNSNLILVYGASGTGKTSLIQCGLEKKFQEPDWFPIFIRRYENIIDSIKKRIRNLASTPVKQDDSLKKMAHSLYLDHFKPLYFIFDQFEELFIFGSNEEKDQFIREISSIINLEANYKFVFVIREEYFAFLTEFESQLPGIYDNRLRVEKMTRSNAGEVVLKSCKSFGIEIETDFPARFFEKLFPQKNEIDLTDLQVCLDKLFKNAMKRNPGNPVFSIQLLNEAGGIGDILSNFLDEQLNEFPHREKVMTVLKAFVSPEGTRNQVSIDKIIEFTGRSGKTHAKDEIEAVVHELINRRILREKDENGNYELRHDSLAKRVFDQIPEFEKSILEFEQFIKNRFLEYKRRGTLLDEEALSDIIPYQKKIYLEPEVEDFVLKSRTQAQKKKRYKKIIAAAVTALIFLILTIFLYFTLQEKEKAVKEKIKADYNLGLALKEMAKTHAREKNWPLAKLYALQSISLQMETMNSFFMDMGLPLENLDWNIKFSKPLKHFAPVTAVVFSPDNRYVISGSKDYTIRIWELESGKRISWLKGHYEEVSALSISKDGKFLASGSWDKTIRIWDFSQQSSLAQKLAHDKVITSVSFSPDSKYLASASWDKTIKIWKLSAGKNMNHSATLEGHTGVVHSICFSQNGKLLASASSDKTIKIWAVSNKNFPKLINTLPGHKDTVNSVTFIPDGKYLASGSQDKTIKLWDISNISGIKEVDSIEGYDEVVNTIAFNPNSNLIISGGSDSTLKLWNILRRKPILVLPGFTSAVRSVSFSPDSRYIAAGGDDNALIVWELSKKSGIVELGGQDKIPKEGAFSHDNRYFATGSEDKSIKIWHASDGKLLESFTTDKGISNLNFSPSGKYIAVITEDTDDKYIKIWNRQSGEYKSIFNEKAYEQEVQKRDRHKEIERSSYFFSSRGKYVAGVFEFKGNENRIKIFEIPNGKEMFESNLGNNPVTALAFSPSEEYLAITSGLRGIKISLKKLSNGKNIADLPGHNGRIKTICFSADGKYLSSGGSDCRIILRNLSKKEKIKILEAHKDTVENVVFSPNGKYLASVSSIDEAKIWSVHEGKEISIQALEVFRYPLHSMNFSADGKYLVLLGKNGILKILNIREKREVFTLGGRDYDINKFSFSHDGKYLGIVIQDNSPIIWMFKDILNYLWAGLPFPYNQSDIKELKKNLERNAGYEIKGTDIKNRLFDENVFSWYRQDEESQKEEFAGIIDYLKDVLSKNPENFRAMFELGTKYEAQGKYEEAKKCYLQALRINPYLLEAYTGLGTIYYSKKEFKKAEEYHLKSLKINPDYGGGKLKLARTYAAEKNFSEAISRFKKLTEKQPQYDSAWFRWAEVYIKLGEYDKAIEKLNQALKINPYFQGALTALGQAYLLKGDYRRAEQKFKKAIEIASDYMPPRFWIGLMRMKQGRFDEAFETYNGAIETIIKDNKYGEIKNLETAIEDIESLLEIDPGLIFALFIRGVLHQKMGNVTKAREDLTIFIKEFQGEGKWKKNALKLLEDI